MGKQWIRDRAAFQRRRHQQSNAGRVAGVVFVLTGIGFAIAGVVSGRIVNYALASVMVLWGLWFVRSDAKSRRGETGAVDRGIDRLMDRFGGTWLTGTPRGQLPIYKQPSSDQEDPQDSDGA